MSGIKIKNYPCIHIVSVAALLLIVLLGGFKHRIDYKDIISALNKHKDVQASTVLLNNAPGIIPFKDLNHRKIASINIGSDFSMAFDNMLRNYAPVSSFNFNFLKSGDLQNYTTLIVQVNHQSLYSQEVIEFIQNSLKTKEVIIAGFGQSIALQRLDSYTLPILWNPEQTLASAENSAQIIFGGEAVNGKLSQVISSKHRGTGFSTQKIRLKYSRPEEVGINSQKLNRIDNIVQEAINQRATPGAVVMVVKDGNVIFNKAYGHHTYDESVSTKVNDIFDLASVTKTASTTIAAMKLFDEQKLNLNAGIGNYLDDVRLSNKSDIPVRDVMLHQAGFVNLDFFSNVRPYDHSADSSNAYPIKITNNYYLRKDYYKDVMWPKMLRTPLPTRGQYVYSDISMFMMKEIIEHQAGTSLDRYVSEQFYQPLGMRTAGYNPLRRFEKDNIVPTERDTYFRKTLLQGYVHDSGAALASGVSGHAGLFASANDLAILNQMLLNGGTYGGVNYLKPETVHLFTSKQSNVSRRGLGFDKGTGLGYPSRYASSETYGHTGYTGTCVWVDPAQKLIYIFLSNRVYPSASNKLNSLRIRPRIQDVVYEAINEGNRKLAGIN